MFPFRSTRQPRSRPVTAVTASLAGLAAFAAVPLAAAPPATAAGAPPAAAQLDASGFRGVNWAMPGDNFTDDPVVPEGLSRSDDYDTVYAKAAAIIGEFESTIGANTVRLPINADSVPGTAWGDAYAGAVDAATDAGFNVVLSVWEGSSTANGRIDDMAAFNAMWDAVVDRWLPDDRVYFEPMNEPHGYSAQEWADIAAAWLADRPEVPRERVFVSGHGYNGDVTAVCGDSRLDGTYLSLHVYTFFFGEMDYGAWRETVRSRVGGCGSRTVVDEFGAPTDDGRDYNDPDSADNFVRYIRAVTDTVREEGMGAVYWPALGGKHTERPDYDWYSLYALEGSGTDLTLRLRSQSMADRLQHAWGLTG
ncbi:cellulase family glycosylhydrolase [Streptomyces sp. 7-21]|uniref:cellulase family glycosylhydrolase n=1 Tax=Streptomyces sp. 7-21 TaxID=2802283 RepID=UPI00191E7C0C|nr:cellulase family glycosylhydrolase [Streptomyces sp. 7-21]MBL1065212.1 cellulase family glycosylhydrolase [Streptomyces sp. 7-21]